MDETLNHHEWMDLTKCHRSTVIGFILVLALAFRAFTDELIGVDFDRHIRLQAGGVSWDLNPADVRKSSSLPSMWRRST